MKAINLSWVLIACLIAGQASVGSIGLSSIYSYMDWDPDCSKPSRPYYVATDVTTYNFAVNKFNDYVGAAKRYMDCIQSEADSDLEILVQAIENGLDEKTSAILNEVDSARFDLELQRIRIP